MPVYDLGYRKYEGRMARRGLRFWPIARTSFCTVLRWPFWAVFVGGMIPLAVHLVRAYATGVVAGPLRRVANPWGFGDGLFYHLLTFEIFWTVLLLTIAGAGQIAEDLRSGALQIYFSKPITQLDYVIGKLAAVVFAALLMTLGPSILLFLGVAAFAPDWSWLAENPLLPVKVVMFSLLVSTVLGSAVLALSSCGHRGRMVGITFAGIWFTGWAMGMALPDVFDDPRWAAVHVGQCLESAGRTFFSAGTVPAAPAGIAWIVLGAIVAVSMLVFTRRIDTAEVVR